jgi:hypothetical protein
LQMPTTAMTDDAWQARVTRDAAREIGRWLEGRGRLQQPIAALNLGELECMATAAISRFVMLASERIRERPQDSEDLTALLLHPGSAPSAAGRTEASATPTSSASTITPATASARCAASMPARRSPEGITA